MPSYTYYSERLDTYLTLTFKHGFLYGFHLDYSKRLNDTQKEYLKQHLPWNEQARNQIERLGFREMPSQERLRQPSSKIAAFAAAYKEHFGINYQPTPKEKGLIRGVEVSRALLKAYMESQEWWCANAKSISNYANNINQVRQLALTQQPDRKRKRFPDHYDAQFEKKLDEATVQQYWAHLRGLGLRPKKSATGHTIDWVAQEE